MEMVRNVFLNALSFDGIAVILNEISVQIPLLLFFFTLIIHFLAYTIKAISFEGEALNSFTFAKNIFYSNFVSRITHCLKTKKSVVF